MTTGLDCFVFFTSEPDYPTAVSAVNNKPVTNLLTNADTQGVSQESIAADLRRIDDRIDSLLSVQESYKRRVNNCSVCSNKKY
ncbi:hypothetical protein ACKUWK_018335 [Proteus mirabilis]